MAQLDIKSLERKLQLGIEENNKLQIEVERLTSHTSKLKASNFELNQNIEAAMEKCDELTCERAALAEQLDLMEASHAEERLKLQATSSQQTKLIDFLQCKAEGQGLKKKKVSASTLLKRPIITFRHASRSYSNFVDHEIISHRDCAKYSVDYKEIFKVYSS